MKIKSITFDRSPRIPGLRAGDLVTVECDNPGALIDWRVVLRGPMMFLISPRGWCGKPRSQWEPTGPVVIAQLPLEHCSIQWFADSDTDIDAVLKGGRYDEPHPLGWKPPEPVEEKSLLAQLPPGQMGDA